jgi:hypothetical protein
MGGMDFMREREAMRWLQLTYKVPSEPSQKRVWVWRRLQNLGAYALQNSVYLLPFSEEVEKQFRQLAHDIHEMGGEVSIFSVVALDTTDESRILQALLEVRGGEYSKVVKVCGRLLAKAAHMVETQGWNDQVHAEFAEVLEKVHVLFRAARRHDLLGTHTATMRATAAEALAVCEQVFRVLLDKDYGKVRRLLEMHHELILPYIENEATTSEDENALEPVRSEPPGRVNSRSKPTHLVDGEMLEPPI